MAIVLIALPFEIKVIWKCNQKGSDNSCWAMKWEKATVELGWNLSPVQKKTTTAIKIILCDSNLCNLNAKRTDRIRRRSIGGNRYLTSAPRSVRLMLISVAGVITARLLCRSLAFNTMLMRRWALMEWLMRSWKLISQTVSANSRPRARWMAKR